jgi:uncharacterized membrane protein
MHDETMTAEYRRRMVLFGMLISWCVALVAVRVARTGSGYYLFLIWNLFLACIPPLMARLLRAAHDRHSTFVVQLALVSVWLLFLPNAPYLVTDFVHLKQSTPLLYWYDLMLLLSCAGTGLLLGYTSLFDVHAIAAERFGHKTGWATVVGALLLSGYGVYLGRVQRWNSWDVVTNPGGLFSSIADNVLNPLDHLEVYALSGLVSAVLLLGYAALRMTARPVALRLSK